MLIFVIKTKEIIKNEFFPFIILNLRKSFLLVLKTYTSKYKYFCDLKINFNYIISLNKIIIFCYVSALKRDLFI